MNRLLYIVNDVIDAAIKAGFYYNNTKFYGLCELVNRENQVIPGSYIGNGDYSHVDLDDTYGVGIYHRLLNNDTSEDENSGFGTNKEKQETYRLKLVCYGDMTKVNPSTANISYQVSSDIEKLIPSILTNVQKANLNIRNGSISASTKNLRKNDVYSEEFAGAVDKLSPEKFMFSIEYLVTIKYDKDCPDSLCDTTTPLIDISNLSCENINHPEFGLTEQQIQDCGLLDGECPDGQAKNTQGDVLATVPSGGIGIVADVTHTDTDGSPLVKPAGIPMICTPTPSWQLDFEANNFISTAGITDATQKMAIRQLVYDLKSNNIWNKLRALWPFVGGNATSHSYNLKDVTKFQLTFVNAFTHNSLGATGDGISTYAKTGFLPMSEIETQAQLDNLSMGSYSTAVGNQYDFGSYNTNNNFFLGLMSNNDTVYRASALSAYILSPVSTGFSSGLKWMQRNNSQMEYYQNTTLLKTLIKNTDYQDSGQGGIPPYEMDLFAANLQNVLHYLPTAGRHSLDFIGEHFTLTEYTAMYNAFQAFQTTLGRQL